MASELIMVLHYHAPLGSSDEELSRADDVCYRPLLAALERHQRVQMALHFSGGLLQWLERHDQPLLQALARACERGQVELLGGGCYEPLLPLLPYPDALGQLEKMNSYLQGLLGVGCRGVWLPGSLWEPELVNLLAEAGIQYTLLDDSLFLQAGCPARSLNGYWLTERHGQTLAVFPGNTRLRKAIPWQPVAQVAELLEQLSGEEPDEVLVYADNGAKLGLWPGTEAAAQPGWLDEWFEHLERNAVQTLTPSAWLDKHPPRGRIYLPSGCRRELQALALPREARRRWQEMEQRLQKQQSWEMVEPWLGSVPWQNFLVKYPEANLLHKKMLRVSGKLLEAYEAEIDDQQQLLQQARQELYRGQCHDAYWHGLTPGLYQPQLRHAAYHHLISAEVLLDRVLQGEDDWIALEELDLDGDGTDEVLVETPLLTVAVDPDLGGRVCEIDYRPQSICLTNTMTRWPETYHQQLEREVDQASPSDTPQSAGVLAAEPISVPGLRERLVTETHQRSCFIERFPSPGTTLEQLHRGEYTEEGDFLDGRYRLVRAVIDEAGECDCEVVLEREGVVRREGRGFRLACRKHLLVPADRAELQVTYTLRNLAPEPWEGCFAPEVNLSVPVAEAADGLFEFAGLIGPGPRWRSMGELEEATWFALVDEARHLRLRLECEPPTDVWRHPVETLTRKAAEFEVLFQGVAVLFYWRWQLQPGQEKQVTLRLQIQQLESDGVVPLDV